MPWLTLLHISAVIVWCGALMYMPALLAATVGSRSQGGALAGGSPPLLRTVYTGVATPAALLAIASGTWVFALHGPLAPWLMAKLALVGLLVLGHGACGVLLLRAERGQYTGLRATGWVLGAGTALCLLGIAWLVLNKPVWP